MHPTTWGKPTGWDPILTCSPAIQAHFPAIRSLDLYIQQWMIGEFPLLLGPIPSWIWGIRHLISGTPLVSFEREEATVFMAMLALSLTPTILPWVRFLSSQDIAPPFSSWHSQSWMFHVFWAPAPLVPGYQVTTWKASWATCVLLLFFYLQDITTGRKYPFSSPMWIASLSLPPSIALGYHLANFKLLNLTPD